MLVRAKERVEEILVDHKPSPLTAEQDQAVSDILQEAREFYRNRGTISDQEWSDYREEMKF
jgi:hypothetical protein